MGSRYRRALASVERRAKVVAAVDAEEGRARAASEQLGCETWSTDYRRVLDGVDAVFLVLPHHLHHPVGMECLRAGKHLLVEKPMAVSEAECSDLTRAAEERGLVLMVAYVTRFQPLLVEMGRLIRTQAYGETFQVSMWTEQMTRRAAPDSWLHRRAQVGGGQLFSHGCHYIDLLLAWLGEPVEGFHLGSTRGTPWLDFEGTSNVCLRFADGSLGYHFGTWGARGTRLKYSFHAHCTEGMLEVRLYAGELVLHREAEEEATGKQRVLMRAAPDKAVGAEIAHFVECIESGARPLTDGRRSTQSLRVIWRLYQAEQQGRTADLRGLGLEPSAWG
jgi:predicted dehydrogenase